MEYLAVFSAGLSIGVAVTMTGMFITSRALENAVEIKSDLVDLLVFGLFALFWIFAGCAVMGLIMSLFA